MSYRAIRGWLNGYQQGSIFGAVMVFVAFAAALSTVPRAIDSPPSEKRYVVAKDARANQMEEETWWRWATADPVAAFTLLLALVALGQAGLFVWQLRYMLRGIVDAGVAAKAATKAANAAVEQVAITRNGTATTERAYVFCERIESTPTFKPKTEEVVRWGFRYILKNSGKTPTQYAIMNVNQWHGIKIGDLPNDFRYPDYGNRDRISIGPDATMHSTTFDLTVEQLQMIRDGDSRLYIWGWVEYNDIFDGTERHRSELCFEIMVVGNPIYNTPEAFRYRRHGPFNGIDDECFYRPQHY